MTHTGLPDDYSLATYEANHGIRMFPKSGFYDYRCFDLPPGHVPTPPVARCPCLCESLAEHFANYVARVRREEAAKEQKALRRAERREREFDQAKERS